MTVFLDKILPALIGAIGALLVALLGFYQWRKQQDKAKRADFVAAKRRAYEKLWSTLEEVNLRFHDHRGRNPDLHSQLRSANVFFLKNSLYFEDEEQALINRYIETLDRFRATVYTSGDEDVAIAWEQTGIQAPGLEREAVEIAKELTSLRQTIKSRVLSVVTQD